MRERTTVQKVRLAEGVLTEARAGEVVPRPTLGGSGKVGRGQELKSNPFPNAHGLR